MRHLVAGVTALAGIEMHRVWRNNSYWAGVVAAAAVAVAAVAAVVAAVAAAEKPHSSLDLRPFDYSDDYSCQIQSDERQVDSSRTITECHL